MCSRDIVELREPEIIGLLLIQTGDVFHEPRVGHSGGNALHFTAIVGLDFSEQRRPAPTVVNGVMGSPHKEHGVGVLTDECECCQRRAVLGRKLPSGLVDILDIGEGLPLDVFADDYLHEAMLLGIYDTSAQSCLGSDDSFPRLFETRNVDIRWQSVDRLHNIGSWVLVGKHDKTFLELAAWVDVFDRVGKDTTFRCSQGYNSLTGGRRKQFHGQSVHLRLRCVIG